MGGLLHYLLYSLKYLETFRVKSRIKNKTKTHRDPWHERGDHGPLCIGDGGLGDWGFILLMGQVQLMTTFTALH